MGNNYTNTFIVDTKNDIVKINGNLSINGNLVVSDKTIKCKSIENVLSNNSIIFDIVISGHNLLNFFLSPCKNFIYLSLYCS